MPTSWPSSASRSALSDRVVEHLAGLGDLAPLAEWRYLHRDEIGRGGMGVVYRAFDQELGRDVAVKVLNAPTQSGMAARLLREARIIARLEHPGVVPIYDVGHTPDGLVAYVMKLVRGERLDARIARGLPPGEAHRIFERLCETIAFAHAHGVVHRDLTPQNIMLGSFGEVLVLDWGIAKANDDVSAGAAPDAAIMGTPGYMAPEQASGASGAADARTDVYGLGGILSAMLAADVSRPLAAVIATACADRAEARYASAEDLAADVRRVAAGHPVTVYRESLLERGGRIAGRNRAAITLVLVYLVLRMMLLLGEAF
jgi:eukaryotic-like serine/threonine-protein kinase